MKNGYQMDVAEILGLPAFKCIGDKTRAEIALGLAYLTEVVDHKLPVDKAMQTYIKANTYQAVSDLVERIPEDKLYEPGVLAAIGRFGESMANIYNSFAQISIAEVKGSSADPVTAHDNMDMALALLGRPPLFRERDTAVEE